jgi:hypothetical protein
MDLITTLIHELGHAVYDVGHPDVDGCAFPAGTQSVMNSGGLFGDASRVIRDWDREIFQTHLGTRSANSQIYRSYWSSSSGWQSPFGAYLTNVFHYRPGSMSQLPVARNLGYLNSNGSVQFTGGGTPVSGKYEAGIAGSTVGSTAALMRPVAVAARPGTSEVLIAYLSRANGSYGLNSEVGFVCHRRSFDNGTSYGAATCQTSWLARRNGLTAAYSSRGDAFVIGFVGNNGAMRIGAVPANGSSFPTAERGFVFGGAALTSWHAPALACRTDANDQFGCRAVYQAFDGYGCLTTFKFGLDPNNIVAGEDIKMSSVAPDSSPCFVAFDTPGLGYDPGEDRFMALNVWWNDTIYAYSQYSSSTDWSYNSTPWAVPYSYILAPVLAVRGMYFLGILVGGRFQAWFVKYN